MDRSTDSRDEQFWTARNFGALLVFAAVISVALHATNGDWPAGLEGWGAAAFVGAGLVLLGHSVTHGSLTEQSVKR